MDLPIEVGSLSFHLTRENIHDSLIVLSGNKAEGGGIIDRACARTFHQRRARVAVLSFLCAAPLTAGQFFPRDLTSRILIQSVSFTDRKCSLDSELSKFEGIHVIGDIYTRF